MRLKEQKDSFEIKACNSSENGLRIASSRREQANPSTNMKQPKRSEGSGQPSFAEKAAPLRNPVTDHARPKSSRPTRDPNDPDNLTTEEEEHASVKLTMRSSF